MKYWEGVLPLDTTSDVKVSVSVDFKNTSVDICDDEECIKRMLPMNIRSDDTVTMAVDGRTTFKDRNQLADSSRALSLLRK